MQSLVEAKYVGELQNETMLQYLLVHPSLLSPFKYKALREWESAGVIPCYQVVFNGYYKLNYFIEGYADLASLLPELPPDIFLQYVHNILAIVINLRAVGAMHPVNLETTLDRIFIDEKCHTVYMVYLPVSDGYMDHMNTGYEQVLKDELAAALKAHKNLHSPLASHLGELLARDGIALDQLKASLVEQKPGPTPIPQPKMPVMPELPPPPEEGKGPFVPSELEKAGVKAVTASLTGSLTSDSDTPKIAPPAQAPPPRIIPVARGTLPPVPHPGNTPALVLVGPRKDEIPLEKPETTLGRQSKKVDHAITYSRAISQVHCKITHTEGRYHVIDLYSTNGTFVDGHLLEPQTPVPLSVGNELKLGNICFAVQAAKGTP